MAEAIGLAASIGQLADLSLAIFKTMYQYAEEVKDARNRITTVATDLNHFREAMDAFQVVLLSSDISLAKMKPTWSDELKATIKFSRTILKALDAELDRICERPAKEKGTIRVTTVQRLKWPMVVKVIEKYRDDLMGMKTTLQMLNGTMVLATVTHLNKKSTANHDELVGRIERLDASLKILILEKDKQQHANTQNQGPASPSSTNGTSTPNRSMSFNSIGPPASQTSSSLNKISISSNSSGFTISSTNTGSQQPPPPPPPPPLPLPSPLPPVTQPSMHPDYLACISQLGALQQSIERLGLSINPSPPITTGPEPIAIDPPHMGSTGIPMMAPPRRMSAAKAKQTPAFVKWQLGGVRPKAKTSKPESGKKTATRTEQTPTKDELLTVDDLLRKWSTVYDHKDGRSKSGRRSGTRLS